MLLIGEHMRKTNRNLKKIKFAKSLVVFFVVQLCLIIGFALIYRSHAPLDLSNLKKETIIVDEITYRYLNSGGDITLFSNSKEYVFPKYSYNSFLLYDAAAFKFAKLTPRIAFAPNLDLFGVPSNLINALSIDS